MDTLLLEVQKVLQEYLKESEDPSMIKILAKRAVSAFREYVRYPAAWTEDEIIADMNTHVSCIADLALYESIQQGAEFQSMHIESGLYRMWSGKGSVYTQHGVVPFASV